MSLASGPAIDKHCFVYCGDDACTCSAGPNWPRAVETAPVSPIATHPSLPTPTETSDGR